ncbi:MAG: GNAT family N-acetyltransferase [Bacteroidetes bacterium]|nr:GNAT family N-acetyltransferase [Bacteroidota bacterium]
MSSDLPIEILEANTDDIRIITEIAFPAWEATYLKIVSQEQFDFMYNDMYSDESLRKQFSEGHRFFILYEKKIPAAFLSFVPVENIIRIPKLYVHPSHQKKGLGKILLDKVEEICKGKYEAIELNVNRYNPARFFYEKLGFKIISEIDVPIGKYFMNDYIVRKEI